ncbi:MAG TPA: flagellar brake protein [Thermoanaerobacterales bacterium]|nr:flagellar brake protein [Thermoanaerobacterales bacterium]
MRLKNLLSIGTRLEIHSAKSIYTSQVENIVNDSIIIGLPMKASNYMKVVRGRMLKLGFVSKGNYYYFIGEVQNIIWGDIPLLEIVKLGDIEKIQRRSFYRLKSLINITAKKGDKNITAVGKDISGSGMCIVSRKKVEVGDELNIFLNLKCFGKIQVKGKVVRVEYKKEEPYPYESGVEFYDLTESNRETIIRYIFKEQRRIRQRGMV